MAGETARQLRSMLHTHVKAALIATLCALLAAGAHAAASPSPAAAPSFEKMAAAVAAEEAAMFPLRPEAGTFNGAIWPEPAPTSNSARPGAAPAPAAAPASMHSVDTTQALEAMLIREGILPYGPDVGVIPQRTESDFTQALSPLEALLRSFSGAAKIRAEQSSNMTSNVTVTDVASQHPPLQNATLVVKWNEAAVTLFSAAALPPPVIGRAVFVTHNCLYDTWAAYNDTAIGLYWPRGFQRQTQGRKSERKAEQETAMSYAAYRCLAFLLPTARPALDAFLTVLGYDPAAVNGTSKPARVAAATTDAIIAVRSDDGSNQANNYADTTGYQPTNTPNQIINPNLWQPLSIYNAKTGVNVTQKFTTPQWLNVTSFALTCGTEFLSPAADIYQYGSLGYVAQVNELLEVSAALNDNKKVVVEYWADPTGSQTPPGHWARVCEFISQRDNHTLDDDAKLFFAVSGALLDASITSWAMKRVYNSVRPITSIHYLYADNAVLAWGGPRQGTRIIRGGTWVPYQPSATITPSFPSFTSAHSTFSAAAAQVLRSFTGSDYSGLNATVPPGASLVEPGFVPAAPVSLSWQTFRQMAVEAGYSRILGGIHFHNDNIRGRQTGTAVGWQAWQKAQLLFKGQRPVPSPYCTRADFVHDFPFPQDDPLEDSLVAHAESEGLASTPTVAAPQQ